MRRLLALILALCLCTAVAAAGSFTVPAGLDAIEAEAFAGAGFTELHLGESLQAVGARAFAGNPVRTVFLPQNTAVSFADDTFDDPGLITGYAADDSPNRDAFAQMIRYVSGDVHALVIGNTNYAKPLPACHYDAVNMRSMLQRFRNVNCTVVENVTAAGMLSSISGVLGPAAPEDLCIFYYSGHGASDGSLRGISGSEDNLSPYALRAALDTLSARRIVVILDSCYSGSFIPDAPALYARSAVSPAMEAAAQANSFNAGVLAAFSGSGTMLYSRSGGGSADGRYAVFTACAADGESYAIGGTYGLFTKAFCLPLGWNCETRDAASLTADTNPDGFITFAELSSKVPSTVSYTTLQGKTYTSHVQRSIPFPTLTFLQP